ncbi:MAG: glycosyltransferase, partial [Planctomycetota bacterium]
AEVLVVDDGITDRTAEIVEDLAADFPRQLRALKRPHRGKGAAVAAGMLAAVGEYRFLCDADLAMSFSELPRFLEVAERGVDIVVGSREAPGAKRVGEPVRRHLLGRVFNYVVKLYAVRGIEDTQCGYKLFIAKAALHIFRLLTVEGFAFDVEVLFIAQLHGYSVEELPIVWYHREHSKVRPIRDSFSMFRQVLSIRRNALLGRYRK